MLGTARIYDDELPRLFHFAAEKVNLSPLVEEPIIYLGHRLWAAIRYETLILASYRRPAYHQSADIAMTSIFPRKELYRNYGHTATVYLNTLLLLHTTAYFQASIC